MVLKYSLLKVLGYWKMNFYWIFLGVAQDSTILSQTLISYLFMYSRHLIATNVDACNIFTVNFLIYIFERLRLRKFATKIRRSSRVLICKSLSKTFCEMTIFSADTFASLECIPTATANCLDSCLLPLLIVLLNALGLKPWELGVRCATGGSQAQCTLKEFICEIVLKTDLTILRQHLAKSCEIFEICWTIRTSWTCQSKHTSFRRVTRTW